MTAGNGSPVIPGEDRLLDAEMQGERRGAARRFAAFSDQEVCCLMIAASYSRDRRLRYGAPSSGVLALAALARELEVEVAVRIDRMGGS